MEDIDSDFEPQARPRSCTWPLRRPDFLEKPTAVVSAEGTPPQPEPTQETVPQVPETPDVKQDLAAAATNRKNCSRRNAWGNLSYADLITKAISSAPDQRLTLSQIYDWMVKNVPFFKDKGDSNSSAGWKNSIRHNLSLHSRFMRVQNEGTGKSSWWMLNPDAKPGKSSRRRASSMDTSNSKWEKKRGRAKKKVLEERAKWSTSPTPKLEPSDVDQSPLAFALSSEFRSRASSNASSCGRLSPILANPHAELNDMHDNEVPPMSPIPYADMPPQAYDSPDHLQTDQLTSLAQAMTLNTSLNGSVTSVNSEMNSPVEQLRVPTPLRKGGHQPPNSLFQPNTTSSNGYMFSPPSNYSNCSSDLSPAHSGVQSPYNPYGHNQSMSPLSQQRCSPGMSVAEMSPGYGMSMQQSQNRSQQNTYTSLLNSPDVSFTQANAIINQQQDPMLTHSSSITPQDQGLLMRTRHAHDQILPNCREKSPLTMSPTQGNGVPPYPTGTNPNSLSILLNNRGMSQTQNGHMTSPPQPPINLQQQAPNMHSSPLNHGHGNHVPPQMMPGDLDNLDVDMFKGIDCDMESIINNELDRDGNLDFNFDSPSANNRANVPSWVH